MFDPNVQARGLMPGILLDDLLQQARTSLAAGPAPASLLQSQQPELPVSGGTASPGPDISGLTPASLGGRAGLSLGLPSTALSMLGRWGPAALAPFAAGAGVGLGQIGLFSGLMDTLMDVFGVGRVATNPFQESMQSFFDITPTTGQMGFTGSTPAAQAAFNAQRAGERSGVAPSDITDPSSAPGPPGIADTSPGAGVAPDTGQTSGGATGPTGPGPSAGPSGASGGVGGSAGPSGEAGPGGGGYRYGGTVPGERGKRKRITAHGGERVMSAETSKRFKGWLDAMDQLSQPNPTLDGLLDRARRFHEA